MERLQNSNEAAPRKIQLADDGTGSQLQESTADNIRKERERNAARKQRDVLAKATLENDGGLKVADPPFKPEEFEHFGDSGEIVGDTAQRDIRSGESNRTPVLEANITGNLPLPLKTNATGDVELISLDKDERAINGNDPRKKRVLVAATGSVASIKLPILVRLLQAKSDIEVKVVATERASHFFDEQEIEAPLFSDKHEWEAWKKMTDPVLHIDLRTWADLIVISPLDANTLAKLACGMCDNLITCILRAWNVAKPVIVCPAMNTAMWTHPHTANHLNIVSDFLGYNVIQPVSKALACGDTGVGAMAEPHSIVAVVRATLFGTAGA